MPIAPDQLTAHRNEAAASAEQWLRGKIDDQEVEKTLKAIRNPAAAYSTGGSVLCAVFYWRIWLTLRGTNFYGNAGGIGGLGGGSTNGDIYTDDINKLFRETVSFQFNSAFVYLNVNFFNAHSQLLGNYQGGGVGICGGTGGGSGYWSS